MPRRRRWTDEQLVEAAKNARSIRQILLALGLLPTGANYKMVPSKAEDLGVTLDRLRGQGYLKGQTHRWAAATPLDEVLVEHSSYTKVGYLRKRLVGVGLLDERCAICGLTEWRGQRLSLVLDHVNGTHDDHRRDDLRLLCPNCNSQQETFAGGNRSRLRAVANAPGIGSA